MNDVQKQVISILIVFCTLFLPSTVFAATYGSGNYGQNNYGEGADQLPLTVVDNGPGIPVPQAQGCSDSKPGSVPDIFQINSKKADQTVYFTPVATADRYYVSYGVKSGSYQYGFELLGRSSGVVAATVHQLQPNTVYYYRVRGGNGCAAGEWSNELAAKTGQMFPTYRSTSLLSIIRTFIQKKLSPKVIQTADATLPSATAAPQIQPFAPEVPIVPQTQIVQPQVVSPQITATPAAPTGIWGFIKKLFGR